ncbi:hypothetical protein P168DRAFT_329807 [Aspergillus campestris IBT 28561]|uniref:Uncharacterized protein n=1 Tax=Aspergillus campestris (strain IBT 28561) TaxID=1392248 RepID=A0A2I1CTX0_ASPC2|nr:uncharacterized protein P168DRAFT_329807 [Aspergillus campestris IBT 28561]PKY01059.1 hypothetical protein P168DRAFT_329807 [Aspergillus campestris IBT 28561]
MIVTTLFEGAMSSGSGIAPPRNTMLWRALWPKDGKTDRTTQTQEFGSASKFTLENFLSLRVLRTKISIHRLDYDKFGLDQRFIDEANRMLCEYDSWKVYCDGFKDGHGKKRKEGNFFLAKLYQDSATKVESKEVSESIVSSPANHTRSRAQRRALMEEQDQSPTKLKADANASKSLPAILKGSKKPLALRLKDAREPSDGSKGPPKTPSPPASPASYQWRSPDTPAWMPNETFPKSIDEQIVNTALINFLNAITEHFQLSQHWTMHRKAFEAFVEKGTKKEKLYEARTDGYLADENARRVRALVEVKAATRASRTLEIFMQESAQMAAWILEYPNEPPDPLGRRFQVLQDRNEIFLNFARYGSKYLSYLRGQGSFDETDPETFMTISEVGPFKTSSLGHMEKLVPILLALTLRAVEDDEQELLVAKNKWTVCMGC